MQNPFESGHIKNYILLYASVVVIMVLFFIASTLFRDEKDIEKKVFKTKNIEKSSVAESSAKKEEKEEENSLKSRLKLLDKAY